MSTIEISEINWTKMLAGVATSGAGALLVWLISTVHDLEQDKAIRDAYQNGTNIALQNLSEQIQEVK